MRFTRLFVTVVAFLYLLPCFFAQGEVRLVYFVPSDRTAQTNIDSTIHTLITGAQTWFTNNVSKTFSFEKDDANNAKVYHITGEQTDSYYRTNSKWRVWEEIEASGYNPKNNIYVAFVDLSSEIITSWCGTGGDWDNGGMVTMPASGSCLEGNTGVNTLVHELGHAFGLRHDYRTSTTINLGSSNDPMMSAECNKTWLKGHAYFNNSTSANSTSTTVEIESPVVTGSQVSVTFAISDTNSLYQAQFFHHVSKSWGDDLSLLGCADISGTTATATFSTTTLTSSDDSITLRVLNSNGSAFEQGYTVDLSQLSSTTQNSENNNNVSSSPLDLGSIANNLGQLGPNGADVNGDGIVNIIDLVLVAGGIGEDAAAPSILHRDLNDAPTRAEVQQWLREARKVKLMDPQFQHGILMLEQLLVTLTPEETVLLHNYPNPFNPETWIPYRLAESAEVSISIYAADGTLVRSLELGHQPVGIYESRSHAAYWDGKNKLGETVASGIYFYTLTADDFSATRKMLIRK